MTPLKKTITEKPLYPMRINKYLAFKNYATRREADEFVEQKRVTLNGKLARHGDMVQEKDKVEVTMPKKKHGYVYYAYNKPAGIVTNSPQKDEKSILDTTKFPTPVFPVGRLDKDSYGLIIMTNDGRITDKLLSPSHAHEKEYLVSVDQTLSESFVSKMSKGVTIDGYKTKPCIVEQNGRKKFSIILTEGKNRQIRNMCAELGYRVLLLERVRIMNIQLGSLKQGSFRQILGKEREELLTSLGIK